MSRPNLLFLYTDEQRFDTLAAYGNGRIEMPNLNRLAEQSTVFEQAYVTQPVCTPSRCSLLTGLYPHTSGLTGNNIPLRPETPCLPEMLDGGWFCAHHGKWHLGDEIYPQHGFVEWVGTEDTYHNWYAPHRDQSDRTPYHHYLLSRGIQPEPSSLPPEIGSRFFRPQIHRLPEEHSRPAFLGREACRFIRENRSRPWALYVNFLEPHMPFHSCRDEQYDPREVAVPANIDHSPTPAHSLRARISAANYLARGYEGQPLRTEQDWRRLIARYWGMCSLVDTHVGSILRTLSDCGLEDDTIVVFTSDHGDMMGSHRLMGKGLMFEESSRVPLMVRLPGQRSGRRIAGPVSQVDLAPTLLELMGQPAPHELEGSSLAPLLAGGSRTARGDVFMEWNSDGGEAKSPKGLPAHLEGLCTPQQAQQAAGESIRTVVTTDGWKFNWSSVGQHELFDLSADPMETRNIAFQADQKARIGDLAGRIRAWQDRTGDGLKLPEA